MTLREHPSNLLDERLADCRRIFFRELALEVSIGFHPPELKAKQTVLIDLDLYVPLAVSSPVRDSVRETLDYDSVSKRVAEVAGSGHFNLQETLLDAIVAALLVNPKVRAVRISTEKPNAYSNCKAVGIEIFRFASPSSAVPPS